MTKTNKTSRAYLVSYTNKFDDAPPAQERHQSRATDILAVARGFFDQSQIDDGWIVLRVNGLAV